MKIALITTTINVPTVLKLYRDCSNDVMFFITGDRKTDDMAVVDMLYDIPNHAYYGIDTQHKLGYKCSALLGENTIGRRNIALLEALKWGAEIIVTVDDDNLPMTTDYFDRFEMVLGSPFSGIGVSGFNGWFDVGQLLLPPARHRGFPHDVNSLWRADPVVDVKIGVAAGICLGDPDIGAVDRISQHPACYGTSELLRAGIVVEPTSWTVFNSQNTAFLRQFAACFLMVPSFGRYDDIIASLVAQRVMREHDHYLHFGQPFVYQQRNEHNLLKDLDAETWGMENLTSIAGCMDKQTMRGIDPTEQVLEIYTWLCETMFIPANLLPLVRAWIEDVRSVL